MAAKVERALAGNSVARAEFEGRDMIIAEARDEIALDRQPAGAEAFLIAQVERGIRAGPRPSSEAEGRNAASSRDAGNIGQGKRQRRRDVLALRRQAANACSAPPAGGDQSDRAGASSLRHRWSIRRSRCARRSLAACASGRAQRCGSAWYGCGYSWRRQASRSDRRAAAKGGSRWRTCGCGWIWTNSRAGLHRAIVAS